MKSREKTIPGNAKHKDDLNHLGKKNKNDDYENREIMAPVSHLIKWLDNREVSFNSKRDGQVDTASHRALEEVINDKEDEGEKNGQGPEQLEDCKARYNARCGWRRCSSGWRWRR